MLNLKKFIGGFVVTFIVMLILPSGTKADSIEEVISSKEITIKSIPITDMSSYYRISEVVDEMYPRYGIINCNEDYTVCDVSYEGDVVVENVKLNYVYDSDVKKVVDNIMKNIPEDGIDLNLTDIEFINYILNASESEEYINIATYSGELKKLIGYKNFVVEPRMGDEGEFFSFQGGTSVFDYDGTIYGFADGIRVYAKYVVYVLDDTTDISKSIKERLSKFFDIENVTTTGYTVSEYLSDKEDEFGNWYDAYENYFSSQNITKEQYVENLMNQYFYGEDASCDFLLDAEDELYGIEFSNGLMLQIAVVKDSSKVNDDIELITNDVSSDVTISTNSKTIPLDTLISVAKLTSGDEYDKIIKLLNVTNSEMFDLKLFSKTIEDDYAVFTTDHFSIYTLAEASATSSPQTSDNIIIYMIISILSLVAVIATSLTIKKLKAESN